MVDINIGNGQGITQAIRDKIGAANIKNKDAATWQKVVAEVNSAQNSKSIFKSGDNYTTDSTKLNEKSTFQSNFVVDKGTVTIDDSVWSKIQNLLTGGNETTKALSAQPKDETIKDNNLPEVVVTANELKRTKTITNPADMSLKPNIGHIDVAPQATGKQLNRMVNGQKQAIEILHDKDGNKVRYAVNDDGTRGEQLVTVTTAGKNTYVTKSEFDKTVKSVLQLGENDEIPKGLNAEYVSIGGEATLVFKGKDGHVMTGSEVKKFMTYYKQDLYDRTAHGSGEYAGKSIKDITNDVVSKIDYSKLSPNFMEAALKQDGVQLNYGGQKYTVHQGNLVDAQGNKFSVQNNKLVPVKTSQEPVQTYGKHGNLNVDNDSSGGPFIKRGRLHFEE